MANPTVPPLLTAMYGRRPDVTPIWFMRQAGRSLPEYRKIREHVGMIEACLNPEFAAEITVQPVKKHRVDAAIFFSDIMVPLILAGIDVTIEPGSGPHLTRPVSTGKEIAEIVHMNVDNMDIIRGAVTLTCKKLSTIPSGNAPWTPLIGFAGAPFTIAAYMVEGKPSRDHLAARSLMHADPHAWAILMSWVADLSGQFLRAQVEAGASAVQLFDSWAGCLSEHDYRNYVAPWSVQTLSHISDLDVPIIHFGVGTSHLLPAMTEVVKLAKYPIQGVDHRINLRDAIRTISRVANIPVQGNLDPALLFTSWPTIQKHIDSILESGKSAPGHIFNLGHGVPPHTDPDVLTRIVHYIHSQNT